MTAFGGGGPDRSRRWRLGIAGGITAVAVIVLLLAGGGTDDPPGQDDVATPPDDVVVTTTSAQPSSSSTTVYAVPLGEDWLPKESSRFSESEEAKLRRDARPDPSTTTSSSLDEPDDEERFDAGSSAGTGG